MNRYESYNKDNVRTMIHREFRDAGAKTVLFLPSSQRFELESLVATGFELRDLRAVECTSQVMSNFTRKLTEREKFDLPRFRCSVAEVGRLLERNSIDAANLDFCCNAKFACPEIFSFAKSGCLSYNAIVAVQTWARGTSRYGREFDIESSLAEALPDSIVYRLWMGERYFNEVSKCNMAYSLFKIQPRVTR